MDDNVDEDNWTWTVKYDIRVFEMISVQAMESLLSDYTQKDERENTKSTFG